MWEEVNNEKTQAFIKKYSRQIIAGVLIVLIATTAIIIGVRTHRANKLAIAENYEMAVQKLDANLLASVAANTNGATADLALFQAYMFDNDIEKLERLANDGESRDFRDLARLHIVGLRGDDMTADEVADYLEPLNTKKSPYFYNAQLLVAQKYLADGNRAKANEYLDEIINDADAPAVVSATAQALR